MPLHNESSQDERLRDRFNREARNEIYGRLHDLSDIVNQRQLDERVSALREKSRAHYEDNCERWVLKEIDRLSHERHRPAGNAPLPTGWIHQQGQRSTDPQRIRQDAEYNVQCRYQSRLDCIDAAYKRMQVDLVEHAQERSQSR